MCYFFHWSCCQSSHWFQNKYSIQTTIPMTLLCTTRQFLNSCTLTQQRWFVWPEDLVDSRHISKPISVWTEWGTDSSYCPFQLFSWTKWDRLLIEWETKDWIPKYSRLRLDYRWQRIQVFPALGQMNSPWDAGGLQLAVKIESTKVHLLASSIGPSHPQSSCFIETYTLK